MLKSSSLAALVLAASSLACSPTTTTQTTPPETTGTTGGGPTIGSPPVDGTGGTDPAGTPATSGQTSTSTTPGPTPGVVAGGRDDSRFLDEKISHSKGVAGGVVVLWPRIIPATIAEENSQIAAQLQAKMKSVVERALPGRAIDMRPKPERVCPKAGCDAMSINVLFTRNSTACAAVAIINAPGTSQTKLMPWGGTVELKSDTIPFRDMPENFVKIKDYQPCDQLIASMAEADQFIEAAIRAAAGGAAPSSAPSSAPSAGTTPAGPGAITSKPTGK
ncbi:MAG: hypothetical protein H0T76_28935 [Nannocystis sp.]|nr:hypothetical protein [Nannocystis sp.]MBA3550520.1 hypothetical protein [Nannocystis sp.]